MSRYYRHLIEDGKLLDIYPNASAAYSLRLLRSGYTGPLVNIRRTSDSVNQDFSALQSGELDWDAIGDFVGWNLLTFSEDLTQATYSKTNVTVSANALQAPDGNTTGDILLENTTNGTHVMTRAFSFTTLNTHTVSFWAKANGRDFFRIVTSSNFSWNPGTAAVAWINLSTGSIVSQNSGFSNGPSNLTIAPDLYGWYKISYTMPANATGGQTIAQLNLSTDGSTISYVGDVTKGVAFWGFQISETSTVKSYFPTTTVAGGEGRLRIWYDQSGANRNATASGAATSQSILTVRGYPYLNLDNGKPALQLVAQTRASLSSNISISSPHFMIGAYRRITSSMTLFGNSIVGGSPRIISHFGSAGSRTIEYRFTNNGNDILSVSYEALESMITTATRNSNDMQLYINNNFIGSRNTPLAGGGLNITTLFQPNSAANVVGGDIHEMIFWNQDYTALRENISDKINEHYGIY